MWKILTFSNRFEAILEAHFVDILLNDGVVIWSDGKLMIFVCARRKAQRSRSLVEYRKLELSPNQARTHHLDIVHQSPE
jgi:hypothetical protein